MAALPMVRGAVRSGRVGAVLIALVALGLGGCASADDDSSNTSPATSPTSLNELPPASSGATASGTSSASASGATVTIAITGGKASVTPSELKVTANEPVKLQVTSDAANELHVHGLDVEQELEAGVPTTLNLSFPDPGVYEIELHDPALHLLDVTVGSVG